MNKDTETIQNKSEKMVYLVRHGESVGNVARVFQSHSGGLSSVGQEQARMLAERFLDIPVDLILASTMDRARQTAEAINAVIQKPIEFTDLLVEVRRPSVLHGKPIDDEDAIEIRKQLRLEDHEPTWRFSDEENFSDRMERAGKVIDLIFSRPKKHVALVSHGTFLRTLLSYMALGKDMTPAEHIKFLLFFHKFNTGISVCNWAKDDFGEFRWKLLHWNDVVHLG